MAMAVRSPMPGTEIDQLVTPAQVRKGFQDIDDPGYFLVPVGRVLLDLGLDLGPDPVVAGVFETAFPGGEFLLDLFEKGEVPGEVGEALVRDAARLALAGAGGDEAGIALVVLDTDLLEGGVELHLLGLEHEDVDAGLAQMSGHALFVASGGLDPGTDDAEFLQEADKLAPTLLVVGDLEGAEAAMDGDVEFVLGCIDAGGCDSGGHLRHPCLVSEHFGSGNHAGQMKNAGAIKLQSSQKRLRVRRSDHQRLRRGWPPRRSDPLRDRGQE